MKNFLIGLTIFLAITSVQARMCSSDTCRQSHGRCNRDNVFEIGRYNQIGGDNSNGDYKVDCYCPCDVDPLQPQYEEWSRESVNDPYNNYDNPLLIIDSNNIISARTCGLIIPGREGKKDYWPTEPQKCKFAVAKKILDKEQVEKFVYDYVLFQISSLDKYYKAQLHEIYKQIGDASLKKQMAELKTKLKEEVRNEVIKDLFDRIKSNKPLSDGLKNALKNE